MTPKQFIQIAQCLGMTIQQVTDTIYGPEEWPTPKQVRAEAENMAAHYEEMATDCAPCDANLRYHFRMMDKAEFLRNL